MPAFYFGLRGAVATGSGLGAAGLLSQWVLSSSVRSEEKVDPPKYPWSHSGMASSFDHARYS